ncbi:hypothetical protein B0J11DRAFT_421143 [Dendryphion nanum]|uniref:F-box domain-containing protein n=1 Tax=Dendryphion nanum TaxID=256645 RepID=A0A9P9EJJ5_9PLEO|nr:hypothetical protein B0J11DRAFT_421143 [Dendryphion nanum]
MVAEVNKRRHILSQGSEDFSSERQSLLLSELELLLNLKPSQLRSNLLALPRELRDLIFGYLLPDPPSDPRPELHTCLWGADMVHEPWRHDVYGYAVSVPISVRLHPRLLLINRQLRDEILALYFHRSKLTLHAELRNSKDNNFHFDYSPHILKLSMLKYVTHIQFYVEWNFTVRTLDLIENQIRMANDLTSAMDKLLSPLQAVETVELSILCFWKYRSGKFYSLSMQDLFDLEDVFKRHAEKRWLQILRKSKYGIASPNPCAGVGYKLSSEKKGTEQSGGIDIYVSQNLEDAMQERRRSNVDFYGNYGIADPLPQPRFELGAMF